MRRSGSSLARMVSLCLLVGCGMIGCGDDEEVVIVDMCAQALDTMNCTACREIAFSRIDDLKECVSGCSA